MVIFFVILRLIKKITLLHLKYREKMKKIFLIIVLIFVLKSTLFAQIYPNKIDTSDYKMDSLYQNRIKKQIEIQH